MAFRLLRYQVRIWEDWLAEHPDAQALPMIIPLVMYHGVEPWPAALDFGAILDIPASLREAVAEHLVQFSYVLHDLSAISDEELRAGALTAAAKLMALCFKHARSRPDFLELFTRWVDLVRELLDAPHGLKTFEQILRYILEVRDPRQRQALEAILVRELGPKAKEALMTIGQQLREEGREEGRVDEARASLYKVLASRSLRVTRAVRTRIDAEPSLERIRAWFNAALTATATADVFRAR